MVRHFQHRVLEGPALNKPFDRYTHYLFRYPAKFHPPIVRTLIEAHSKRGDTILDPFVGSGTLLVESAIHGRHAIGWDVDPVAIAIASVKSQKYDITALHTEAARLLRILKRYERTDSEYTRRMHVDLSQAAYQRAATPLLRFIPAIPNIEHWFRRYVIVDLARIVQAIARCKLSRKHRTFFEVVFASIIRNSSNADPVPVSGLEVTAHMRKRDKVGRLVNPFTLFKQALSKALIATSDFAKTAHPRVNTTAIQVDATVGVKGRMPHVDVVITSPPYQGAVDYYRRHTLETYWLGFARSHGDRLPVMRKYLGRLKVGQREPLVEADLPPSPLTRRWEKRIRKVSAERANAFKHYMNGMHRLFIQLAKLLRYQARAIFVVGNSNWGHTTIPTSTLFYELALPFFRLEKVYRYRLRNRYMSYTRHNGADIKDEFVLVLRRTKKQYMVQPRGDFRRHS